MKKLLKEEITLKQMQLGKMGEWTVYYLKPENKEDSNLIYQYYPILKKHGAQFNKPNSVWFWFVDKDNPEKTKAKIKVALDELNDAIKSSATGPQQSQEAQKLLIDVDKVLNAINAENPAKNPDFNLTQQDQDNIKSKLESFKQMLVNIEDDEEFKDAMKKIIDFKAAQGYEFSLMNALLILLQNRKATIVNSKSNWETKYNRTVNPNATTLVVWAPQGARFSTPKEKIAAAKSDFYKSLGKREGDPLTPKQKFDLDKIVKPKIQASGFKLVPVFDVADTTQKEGTEDYIKKSEEAKKQMKWFEDNMISDEVKPIYKALVDFAEDNQIEIEVLDDIGGARGVSKSGKIGILKNEGNDVGLTKTLAHEITHELLHQKYLSQKGKETGKYYIGQPSRDTVEQQAELSAWMFMYAFGFDLKTTSLNYTIMWGGNKENMIKVFDTVSKVVNHLIDYVNKKITQPVQEDDNETTVTTGKHISPQDIAQVLGVEKTYNQLKHSDIQERLLKKLNLK